jgi:anti-anti-sigma factor
MGIAIKKNGKTAEVALSGEMTIYTASEIKSALAAEMVEIETLEIDLAAVSEMDTAGLQLMLIAKRLPGKDVRFVNHSQAALRLIDLANLGGALGDPLFIAAAHS